MGSLHVGLEVRLRQPGELSPAVSHSALKVSTRIFLRGTANKYLPKESASQFNKSILKDNPYIHKLSGTYLFPRSRYQYIYQQRVVANCNEWLRTTSGCEQRVVAGTFGAGVF